MLTIVALSHGGTTLLRNSLDMKEAKLNQVLKGLMRERKVSVRDLSRATKIPVSTLSSYIASPKSTYAPEHLVALSTYFSVSIDRLITGESPSELHLKGLPLESLFDGIVRLRIDRVKGGEK